METMVLLTKSGALVGCIVHEPPRGYRFLSNTSAHEDGRKHRPTVNAAIPRWAFKISDDIVPWSEWQERQRRSKGK